ncbi:Hypp7671 [Branchiostoma lanceolatum]|uniref:Hypp7671 protein n=1 Tax=Branchiostoma lanceolatum TaxID=7740 RepID=A0A8J9Z208_BRALA|nr:Hypp7671 [Branchiostoma lanceolatum]
MVSHFVLFQLIAPSYLANGGSGYTMITLVKPGPHIAPRYIGRERGPELDTDALIAYIRDTSPITTGVERRITFGEGAPACASETPQCPSVSPPCPSEAPSSVFLTPLDASEAPPGVSGGTTTASASLLVMCYMTCTSYLSA